MTILDSSKILAGLSSFGVDSMEADKHLSHMLEGDNANMVFSDFLDGVSEHSIEGEPSLKFDEVMPSK